ncbi:hypothetical protein CF327_g1334 [Tilletia walkeri]|nr:hypothetical protein CF327_g1334 [Tilletia walkeri]
MAATTATTTAETGVSRCSVSSLRDTVRYSQEMVKRRKTNCTHRPASAVDATLQCTSTLTTEAATTTTAAVTVNGTVPTPYEAQLASRRRTSAAAPRNRYSTLSSFILPLLLFLLLMQTAVSAQRQSSSKSNTPTSLAAPAATTSPPASGVAIALTDYVPAQSTLQATSSSGIFFSFAIPKNTTTTTVTAADGSQSTQRAASTRLSVSISLCGGPSIQPYDLNNVTLVKSLSSDGSAAEVRQLTLLRAYWTSSTDALTVIPRSSAGSATGETNVNPTLFADASQPGPNAQASSGIKGTHLSGGASLIQATIDRDVDNVFTLGVWPPQDVRGISSGAWAVRAIASMEVAPELVSTSAGVALDDTDQTHALVTSEWYSTVSPVDKSRITPNVSLFILPSSGPAALDPYFNSSLCALEQSFAAFRATASGNQDLSGPLIFNMSETSRGIIDTPVSSRTPAISLAERIRMQVLVNNLLPATNYTAWMQWTRPQYPTVPQGVFGSVLYPAIKFVTKASPNCRLITNLDFCPSVAYSIPIAPDIDISIAVAAANLTITPNMVNFSRTIDTFPCGDTYFGQYSFVSSCADCKNAYRDWLCAIVLPRCTDPVPDPGAQSAASQTGAELTGASTGTNTRLLPYVVNRNENGTSTSRRPYIDALLKPGTYGELLPCIYTCHFVSRACPPISGWSWGCPVWDISAQRDYGTFVDAGPRGIGADMNGGDGSGSDGTGVGRNATNVKGGGGKGGNSTATPGQNRPGGDGSGSGSGSGPDNLDPGSSGSGTDGTGESNTPGLGQVFTSRGDDLAKGAGQRWGGISRYVATDAFGHQYCNALGIDLVLRQQNGGLRRAVVGGGGGRLGVGVIMICAGAVVAVPLLLV